MQDDLLYDGDEPREMNPADSEKYRELRDKRTFLERRLKHSICSCGFCGKIKGDMVFHEGWLEWWCPECFKSDEEVTDPKQFFNEGIIVVENSAKPCWELQWCPYGSLVEDFQIRMIRDYHTCEVFDHDCPVYYVRGDFTEESPELPSENPKLKQTLRSCRAFNDIQVRARISTRPCHVLKWCPYGSLGDEFFQRAIEYMYGCKIFPHDCPAYYHAERFYESIW